MSVELSPDARKRLEVELAKRRRTDPCFNYSLSPDQERMLSCPQIFRLVSGSTRSGKTMLSCLDLALVARGIHPIRKFPGPVRILALTDSRAQAAQVYGRKLFNACEIPGPLHETPFIPKYDIVKISTIKAGLEVPYHCQLRNGSEIIFAWSGTDATWKRVQGMKIDAVYLDEDAGMETLIDELFMRGLDSRSDILRPFGGMMTWSATPTVGSDSLQKFKRFCESGDAMATVFNFKSADNPAITDAALTQARAFLGEDASRMRIDATHSALDLVSIFGRQWDDKRHLLPSDYQIQPGDNLWLGYDPGVVHPTGMVILALNRQFPTRAIAVKCWKHSHQTLSYDIDCLQGWLRGRRLAGVVYDTAAKISLKHSGSVFEAMVGMFRERSMMPYAGFFASQKDHAHGISMVRHYLDPDPNNRAADPLLMLNPSEESGCLMLRQEMLAYRGKEGTRFSGPGGVVKKNDDIIDSLRYALCRRPAWFEGFACGNICQGAALPTEPEKQTAKAIPATPTEARPADYGSFLRISRARRRPGSDWQESSF